MTPATGGRTIGANCPLHGAKRVYRWGEGFAAGDMCPVSGEVLDRGAAVLTQCPAMCRHASPTQTHTPLQNGGDGATVRMPVMFAHCEGVALVW